MKTLILPLFVLPVVASAAPKTFTIIADKLAYRNVATVESESEFETFTGKTTAVSGSLSFDPAKKSGSGWISIDAATIDTGIPLRNDHMKSAGWLDTEKFPTIKFVTKSVKNTGGDNYTVSGSFTLHGVTKQVTAKARVRYKAEGPVTKAAGFEGDVIQLSTKFQIKLSDYGIKIPDMAKGKVSNVVTLGVSTYALSK